MIRVYAKSIHHAKQLDELAVDEIVFNTKFGVFDTSFTIDEIKDIKLNARKIIAIDKILHDHDFEELRMMLETLSSSVDALIFSDFGIIPLVQALQLNYYLIYDGLMIATSTKALEVLKNQGVDEFVLSRELTLDELNDISNNLDNTAVFVQGYFPIFYSIRPLVQNYFEVINEKMPNTMITMYDKLRRASYPIFEEKDLCTIYSHFEQCMIEDYNKLATDKLVFAQPFISEEQAIAILKLYLDKNAYTVNDVSTISLVKESRGFLYKKTLYKINHV